MSDRTIIHMDLDTFFVSCERLINSKLIGKPVLIGGTSDRGVVASCSYEARKFGVHSAMPMRLAKRLCPEAFIIRGDSGVYSKYSNLVTDIIKEDSPIYEKSSIDEFYIDASGMDKFYSCYKWATELRQRITRETGLPISFGMSTNKTVSKVGTGQAKPDGQIIIKSGLEKPFLAPLSIQKIPMVGEKTFILLRNMGVEYIHTMQKMPIEVIQRVLGANGKNIWKKCNGIDNSPIVPYQERKSISSEITFEKDSTDINKLLNIIIAMTENLAFQLRNGNKLTACLAVKVRYSDMQTYTKQRRIPYTSSDNVLIDTAKDLFNEVYNRRVRVRLVGVSFSHFVEGGQQINLFEDTEELISLYQAMDVLRNRYGMKAVIRCAGLGTRGFGRMNSFTGEPPVIPAHRRQ
ncbi:DNA polymerase IV [Flavobacteriales bacterium]|nr:DNA polymerase IV [Flavobacteriales bacterium]